MKSSSLLISFGLNKISREYLSLNTRQFNFIDNKTWALCSKVVEEFLLLVFYRLIFVTLYTTKLDKNRQLVFWISVIDNQLQLNIDIGLQSAGWAWCYNLIFNLVIWSRKLFTLWEKKYIVILFDCTGISRIG